MSYWVYLQKDGETVELSQGHQEGGTFVMGGTDEAELNVTYNYSKYFATKDLDGRTAKETIPLLEDVVKRLGTERDEDYWKPTEGNAGYMCSILLDWAKQYPDGIWKVN